MGKWKKKHLIDVTDLSEDELSGVLDLAAEFKEKGFGREPLKGMTVANMFYEASTRTANSFAQAARNIGCATLNFSKGSSSVSKGETLGDTARVIEAMGVDGFVIRHSAPGAAKLISAIVEGAVANGGDGRHAHPTQCLLDLMTMRGNNGGFKGLKVAIIGDILHSRVARSLMAGLGKLGAEVAVAGPSTMMPGTLPDGVMRLGGIEEAMGWAKVLYFLRIQLERQGRPLIASLREYHETYGLTAERMGSLKREQLIMHPGPVNRGVELAARSADCGAARILEQVANGVYVRMAVLYLLLSAAKGREVSIG
ncbi:MAG: aspartate carbamoyltransferase catalytic subunit [Planctomycetes bacterium]|nr:aspartate carbamoyltransferase catalytic subunit [Planctomycetota bacterium]